MKTFIRVLLLVFGLIVLLLGIFYMMSGSQTEIVNTIQINKPPYEVIDYISDMRNELKWNPDVQYVEKKSDGPIDVGTVFRAKWHKSDTLDVTVTEYYPPYWVAFENALEGAHKLVLSPIEEGTKLESTFITTPHGFTRAIFPIFKAQLKAQKKENMMNLKRALENN